MDPCATTAIVNQLDCALKVVEEEWDKGPEKEPWGGRVSRVASEVQRRGIYGYAQARFLVGEDRPYKIIPAHDYERLYTLVGISQREARAILGRVGRDHNEDVGTFERAMGDWVINGTACVKLPFSMEAPPHLVLSASRHFAVHRIMKGLSMSKGRELKEGLVSVTALGPMIRVKATCGDGSTIDGVFCENRMRMLATVLRKRFQVLLAYWLSCASRDFSSLVLAVWRWQDSVLTTMGEPGFEIGKGVESAGRCLISVVSGGDIGIGGLDDLLAKYRAKVEKVLPGRPDIIDGLENLCNSVSTVDEALEMFGVMSCFGHPTLDVESGALQQQAARAKTEKDTEVDPAMMVKIYAKLQERAIMMTISRKGVWPRFDVPPRRGTRLWTLHRNRTLAFDPRSVPVSEWAGVTVGQLVRYNPPAVWTDLLDDKSLASNVSETESFFSRPVPEESANRRLLIKALSQLAFSPAELLDKVRNRSFTQDEMATVCVPKLEEHKCKGRYFSIETLGPRTAMKLLEEAAGEVMAEIFPETTMVLTRTQFDNLAQEAFRLSGDSIFAEFDLSDWNINWERANTYPIMVGLDHIVGERDFFTFQHWFFPRTTVSFRVKGFRVGMTRDGELDSHTLSWGPLSVNKSFVDDAGREGKQQKPWTIITGLVAMVVADAFPELTVTWVVQGDNLTARVKGVGPHVDVKSHMTRFIDEMTSAFRKIRQDLKPEESVFSRTVATYSKSVWVNGFEYASIAKWASTFRTFSAGTPWDVTSASTSLGAGASATSSRCRWPHRMTALARFLLRLDLDVLSQFPSFKDYTNPGMRQALMSIPSVLGGRCIPTYAQSIVRGAADPTANEIAMIVRMAKVCSWHRDFLHFFRTSAFLRQPNPNLSLLVADPYSLPLSVGSSVAARLVDCVRPAVIEATRNPHVKELLGLEDEAARVRSFLSKARPMYASLYRGVSDCCGSGIATRVVSRFTSSTTFTQGDYYQMGIPDEVRSIKSDGDRTRTAWLRNFSTLKEGNLPEKSPYEILVELRGWWGLGQDSFTGINNVSPLGATLTLGDTEDVIGAACLTDLREAAGKRGDHKVYFGASTKEKRSESGYVADQSGSVVDSIKKLVTITSQLDPGPNLRAYISDIIKSLCGQSYDDIMMYLPKVIGGTAAHRYDDDRKAAFHLNILPGPASHFLLSSNNAGVLVDDIPLAVQEFYLVAVHILTLAVNEGASGPAAAFLKIPMSGVEPVVTTSPEIPNGTDGRVVPVVNEENPLVAVKGGITFTSVIDDTPTQWSSPVPPPTAPRLIFRSLFIPALASSAGLKSGFFSGDLSVRPLGLDLAEFVKIPFEGLLSEMAFGVAQFSVLGSVMNMVRLGSQSKIQSLLSIMYDTAYSVASIVTAYLGAEYDNLGDIRRTYGISVLPGKDRGSFRRATVAGLIQTRAEYLIHNPHGLAQPVILPCDANSGPAVTRLWAVSALYEAHTSSRVTNWGEIVRVLHRMNKMEFADDAGRCSQMVKVILEESGACRKLHAIVERMGINGPVNWTYGSSPALSRSLRALPELDLRTSTPILKGGYARWFRPYGKGKIYVSEIPVNLGTDKAARLSHRRSLGHGSLAATFYPIVMSLRRKRGGPSISVGAGSGNWTVALVEAGYTVEELDLITTRPAITQDFLNTTSADSQVYAGRGTVRVHPATFMGGNVLDTRIQDILAAQRGALIVIDVQTLPLKFPYPRLKDLTDRLDDYILRVFADRAELMWLARHFGAAITVISVGETGIYDACLSPSPETVSRSEDPVTQAELVSPTSALSMVVRQSLTSPEGLSCFEQFGLSNPAVVIRRLVAQDQIEDKLSYGYVRMAFQARRTDTYFWAALGRILASPSVRNGLTVVGIVEGGMPLVWDHMTLTLPPGGSYIRVATRLAMVIGLLKDIGTLE